jgi:Arc/MetJ-type ribon-helix-helix transcriptional regulator
MSKKIGRPTLGDSVMERTIPVRLTDDMLSMIDALRADRLPAAPNRSQLIRELLAKALRAEGYQ